MFWFVVFTLKKKQKTYISLIYQKKKTNRQRKTLEARGILDDERITTLEKQLAEAQMIAEDADRRYDEVS